MMLRVHNQTRNAMLADHAGIADTSKARRTGLLRHNTLEPGDGLWIAPCEAVHTFGMKFPIDVLYLNRKKKVIKIRENMLRSRVSFCLRAHSVLELPAGTCAATRTVLGDQLVFERL
jgi:uncharacterized membrane protein (UPF0127 family)